LTIPDKADQESLMVSMCPSPSLSTLALHFARRLPTDLEAVSSNHTGPLGSTTRTLNAEETMMYPSVGYGLDVLDTPALLVDLDVMDANIARITAACRAGGVNWRPHIKGIKTPEIALRQIAAGAIGVTCAKLGEAEIMADAGISDLLIANQIVGLDKIKRLIVLRERADPIVAIDSQVHVAALAAGDPNPARPLRVIVEVNLGMNRAGVEPGASAVNLAAEVAGHSGLRFVGLMAWESHAVAIADKNAKEQSVKEALARLAATASLCRAAGYSVDIVSCGGSGTFPFCIAQPGVTEVQIGGAIFSDVHYRDNYHLDLPPALTLLATVTSRPSATRVILDAGRKALPPDIALPQPLRIPALNSMKFSAEHLTLELAAPSEAPRIGDQVEFIVGYSDMTVFLHEEIVGHRKRTIEHVWPIAARGKLK
jgi:D-serine deaminase-like pyridoxal phosphate-dependent protein